MNVKPYDSGLIVGRFQGFTVGHDKLVQTGLMLCERVFILVGSSQESGTERNPFNVSTRFDVIKSVYGDAIQVFAIQDLTNEGDITPDWGRFLLDKVDLFLHKVPDVMIYGNDESRSRWFDTKDIPRMTEVIINRFCENEEENVSATKARRFMVEDNRKEWMKLVPSQEHKFYERLRGELMEVPFYRDLRKTI